MFSTHITPPHENKYIYHFNETEKCWKFIGVTEKEDDIKMASNLSLDFCTEHIRMLS